MESRANHIDCPITRCYWEFVFFFIELEHPQAVGFDQLLDEENGLQSKSCLVENGLTFSGA